MIVTRYKQFNMLIRLACSIANNLCLICLLDEEKHCLLNVLFLITVCL